MKPSDAGATLLTLAAGVGFIEAEEDQQTDESRSDLGTEKGGEQLANVVPNSQSVGHVRRRGRCPFHWLDGPADLRWTAIRLANLDATIVPSREVALWPRPSNAIFLFSKLLRCTRTVEQAISMFGVDEDVS